MLKNNKNKERIILGLDLSTSCIGASLARYDGENIDILKVSHVKTHVPHRLKGTEALFFRARQFREEFLTRYKDIGLTDIIIEEPLPNSQNNNTVTTLLRFNGMISQSIYELTGIVPRYITSYDARKYAFPELMALRKYDKNDELYTLNKYKKALEHNELVLFGGYPFSCQKKYVLWGKICELFPGIEWEYDNNGELTTENFDASDSLVCILGQINKEKYEGKQPKIISYKIDKLLSHGDITLVKVAYKVSFCDKEFDKSVYIDVKKTEISDLKLDK